jgi:hypothetical protein
MAELINEKSTTENSCCSTEAQATCCEPSEERGERRWPVHLLLLLLPQSVRRSSANLRGLRGKVQGGSP